MKNPEQQFNAVLPDSEPRETKVILPNKEVISKTEIQEQTFHLAIPHKPLDSLCFQI